MSEKYKQIFLLYIKNSSFMLLSGIYVLCAVISKVLYIVRKPALAEDMTTIFFVVTLWLTFHVGLLIKRQFSNHRASLLPGYRKSHLNIIGIVYLFFISIACLWEYGLVPLFDITANGILGAYVCCLFIALILTVVGYLSIGRVLLYVYVGLLVFVTQFTHVLALLDQSQHVKYVLILFCFVLIVLFIRRLKRLKEESFEYHFLFSWPPQQDRSLVYSRPGGNIKLVSFLKKWLKVKDQAVFIPAYPKEGNIVERAFHWDYTKEADTKSVSILIVLFMPGLLLLVKNQPALDWFFRSAYSNFLLLSVTPVLVIMGEYYKRIAYWGYDLLKPISREDYFKEKGVVILLKLFCYWLLFCICFAVMPSIVFQPEIFIFKKFWGFLLLTGSSTFLILMWVALLSCIQSANFVLMNGIVLSNVIFALSYWAPHFSFEVSLLVSGVVACGGVILLKKSYRLWCQKEFI